MTLHRRTDRLRTWLDRIARRRGSVPAPQVLVRSPGWEFEFGDMSLPFHSASVGKVMTATLVARLVERGRLDFNTPIGAVLPAADVKDLPGAPGVDVSTDVTVEHLLTHTSGLPDYFDPPRGSETACSVSAAATDRDRRWTPSDILDEVRHLPAIGRPGERFHYGDTGFVVLGRIAEEAAGASLDTLLSTHIYEPSGMADSSTPYSSARTPSDVADLNVAPFWVRGDELSQALCMSLDWAGGGIVGPPEDFVRFQRALHSGQLIAPSLLARLAKPLYRQRRGIHYGAGMVTMRFGEFSPPFLRGLPEPVGGLGYFATHMFYYPHQDAHVVINFNRYRWMSQSVRTHMRIAGLLANRG